MGRRTFGSEHPKKRGVQKIQKLYPVPQGAVTTDTSRRGSGYLEEPRTPQKSDPGYECVYIYIAMKDK